MRKLFFFFVFLFPFILEAQTRVLEIEDDVWVNNDCAVYNSSSAIWETKACTGGAGEANTASNVGTAGVGVFKQKTVVDLEFKKINAGSSKISITDDTGNDEIDIDVVEANLDPASGIMARIGASTFSTIQDMQNIFHSAGWVSGGTINDAGGGNITVDVGTGLIRATDSRTAEIVYFDWGALGSTAIPSDTSRFIGVEYNAGSPQVLVKTSDTWDFNTDFPLGIIVNEGGTLFIYQVEHAVGDHANFMIQRMFDVDPIARDKRSGGLIIGETGTRNITLSAGALWEKLNRFPITAVDTSVSGGFDRYYRDGASGHTKEAAQTQWNNTQYDDGSGTLATMTNNRWAVQWFYIHIDDTLTSVYGVAEYTSEASAEAESAPSDVPDRIGSHGLLTGRVIFQKSAATGTFESAFDTAFAGALVTDHGNLAGLADDDHAAYENELVDSAGLLAALSDETGSGLSVFGTSPTIGTPVLTLEDGNGAAPTADGQIKFDRTTERLQVGDGAATNEFHAGVHTTDTGPSPNCSGTLTYQDGEANCDTYTLSGSTTELGTTSGTLTSGDCVEFDASGNLIAAGAACGSGGGFTPNIFHATLSTDIVLDPTTDFVDMTWAELIEDSNYTHVANAAAVNIDTTGLYKVTAQLYIRNSGTSSQTKYECKVLEDVGAGFVDISGMIGRSYTRNNGIENEANHIGFVFFRDFTATDDIKIQCKEFQDNDATVRSDYNTVFIIEFVR